MLIGNSGETVQHPDPRLSPRASKDTQANWDPANSVPIYKLYGTVICEEIGLGEEFSHLIFLRRGFGSTHVILTAH